MVHSGAGHCLPLLDVRFYRTEAGNEPVRDWLRDLSREQRHLIGTEIKTVQIGWPLGMPLVRKMEQGLWEMRIDLGDTVARLMFTLLGDTLVLLHGFIKKSQKTPAPDLAISRKRKARL